jgi:hypothetical protein
MIDVRVGNNNLLYSQIVFLNDGQDVCDVIAGIDDNRLAGLLIADDRAIALQGTDRQDFVDHGALSCEQRPSSY